MPPEIRRVSKKYMKDPVEVTVGKANTANKNIDHQYYVVAAHHRYEALKRLIDVTRVSTVSSLHVQKSMRKILQRNLPVKVMILMHCMEIFTQQQRDAVMGQFRDKTLQLLIATDVAARGIDVVGITHVINYELPDDMEVYTHRSGRTGRAGNVGICMSIVHSREVGRLKQIERMVQSQFHKLEVPTGKDVCRKQFFLLWIN
jgi:ATP-dependent RNA helicase DeaD